jgi:hypothetical protein
MREVLIAQLQAENEKLKRRIAELEHTLEVQEWGTQLFHESDIPQLLLDFETGAILAANAAARTFYGEALNGRGDIVCVCAEELDWAHGILKAAERAADLNKQLLAYARRQVIQPRRRTWAHGCRARWTSCAVYCPKASTCARRLSRTSGK